MKRILALLFIMAFIGSALAISPNEATAFVSTTNNYLLDGETARTLQPTVMVSYKGSDYWIVTGVSGDATSIYLPINNDKKELANGAIEVRELIKTSIILSRTYSLKSQYSVGDWPFSHPIKTSFYDLENAFNNLSPSITSIETALATIDDADALELKAANVKNLLEEISDQSKDVADSIFDGIEFEKEYFTNPDTNTTVLYESRFEDYFASIDDYKTKYNELKAKIDVLKQEIAAFEGIENNQKEFYIKVLQMPAEAAVLNSLFTRTEQTKTLVEEIFNSSKNIENLVLNLETRVSRNEAWQILYASDDEIATINSSFNSLSEAAKAILAEDNVDYWKDQDSVDALKINWSQAKTKYNNAIYEKAISFGRDARKNAKAILRAGAGEAVDNSGELITQIIIVLVVVLVAVFVIEKFILHKKNKDKMEFEDDENEEEY